MQITSQKPQTKWKFSDLLSETAVRDRWEKVRKYFFLRESTYDMTNRCNMRCEGCYYYEGDKQFSQDHRDPDEWRSLMRQEKARGITYVVLAGAEPSLVPGLLQVCYEEMPLGCIATNGLQRIPESVGYKIHISVWGDDRTSLRVRRSKDLLKKQLDNYRSDPRVVFIYTFTRENIEEIHTVMESLSASGCRVSFNIFSPPVGYTGSLAHNEKSLAHVRSTVIRLMSQYPDHVLYSYYNAVAHTHKSGLHDLYSCSYPRMNSSTDLGLGRSFRQYRADLSWDRSVSCCVPDTDCGECRHYAAGSAVVTARLYRHATDPDTFKSWLDYVDTYLSVWVMGYEKDRNLCNMPISPPGF